MMMKATTTKIIEIIIKAVILILVLIAENKMPVGFYTFLRLFNTVGFIIILEIEYKGKNYYTALLSCTGALLFNPVFKINLKRAQWHTIDYYVAFIIGIWIIYDMVMLIITSKGQAKNEEIIVTDNMLNLLRNKFQDPNMTKKQAIDLTKAVLKHKEDKN